MNETPSNTETTGGGCNVRSSELLGVIAMLRNMANKDKAQFEIEMQAMPPGQQYAWIGPHVCEEAIAIIERQHNALNAIDSQCTADSKAGEWTTSISRIQEFAQAGMTHNASLQVRGARAAGDTSPASDC